MWGSNKKDKAVAKTEETAGPMPMNLPDILGAVQRTLSDLIRYLDRHPMAIDAEGVRQSLGVCYQRMDEFQTLQAAVAANMPAQETAAAKKN